jgi:hypothetical protein
LPVETLVEGMRDLESDDAVALLETLEPEEQAEVLDAMPAQERIVLRRQSLEVPTRLHLADAAGSDHALVPFHAGQRHPWRCERGGQDGSA